MISPISFANMQRIGSVEYVSPDEIRASLDIEAPTDVALNTGVPRPFPRVNSYVLLPSESGYLVAQIEWITIERSQYPKRRGLQDFGIVDLPYPIRKVSLNPLGILKIKEFHVNGESKYEFSRGIENYPTVGDPVLLPSPSQLKAIVESGEKRRVNIGVSPLAGNATISVDPDRLFGRHLAVLGNTGSGKSCSVAGLIRWSLEAAKREALNDQNEINSVNSRFIILDPNGEYSDTFQGLPNVRLFSANPPKNSNVQQLHIPIWFLNSEEWCSFAQASERAQRPTLIQALRAVRDGQVETVLTPSHDMRRYLRTIVSILSILRDLGEPWGRYPKPRDFMEKIEKWKDELKENDAFSETENQALIKLREKIEHLIDERSEEKRTFNIDFTWTEVTELLELAKKAHFAFGGSDTDFLPIDADLPRPFTVDQLLRSIEANAELMGTTEFVETMLMRIRTLLSDAKLKSILTDDPNLKLDQWLNNIICVSNSTEGSVTVIDLSLVPSEIVHIITAVIARMTLEALQRYRRLKNGETLPTIIVMEEAHTFIKRYKDDGEDSSAYAMCTKVFEKIAREGRKFGLGLILSSQRPSELSQTVLSQCNTFLLHRINNDKDQELVSKLVPDNLRGLLRELPTLPSRNAILIGWASELPVLVQMNYLKEEHRPKSDDPEYWNVWTGQIKREVDWEEIAEDWQQIHQNIQSPKIEILGDHDTDLDEYLDKDPFEEDPF